MNEFENTKVTENEDAQDWNTLCNLSKVRYITLCMPQ